jgi:hypothetical protein
MPNHDFYWCLTPFFRRQQDDQQFAVVILNTPLRSDSVTSLWANGMSESSAMGEVTQGA